VNKAQRRTLAALFETPTRADVTWKELESLLKALGASVTEGRGSRVRVSLNERRIVFHRPHPRPILGKSMVGAARRFLIGAGIEP